MCSSTRSLQSECEPPGGLPGGSDRHRRATAGSRRSRRASRRPRGGPTRSDCEHLSGSPPTINGENEHRQMCRAIGLSDPTGRWICGNHKSHCPVSPATEPVCDAGSGGRWAGRSSTTRSLNTVIPPAQPTRLADPVAGIVGKSSSADGRVLESLTAKPPV